MTSYKANLSVVHKVGTDDITNEMHPKNDDVNGHTLQFIDELESLKGIDSVASIKLTCTESAEGLGKMIFTFDVKFNVALTESVRHYIDLISKSGIITVNSMEIITK